MLKFIKPLQLFTLNKSIITRNMSTPLPKRLLGKIAAVTASTDGIGYAIARRLAQEGAKVVISSRKQKNVDLAVETLKCEGLSVTGLVCHVSKSEDRKKLFDELEKLGGLDILVSNAAANPSMDPVLDVSHLKYRRVYHVWFSHFKHTLTNVKYESCYDTVLRKAQPNARINTVCEESAWDKIFEVNVKASWLLAKESLPLLKKSRSGRIVFISSIGGFQPFELLGAYSVSKTALLGLTKAAALQLACDNITVNCVAPGIIKTKFSAALTESQAAQEEAASRIPLNRFGMPHEIGSVVAFIVSDDASYLTGENIVVAGGMTSRL